MFSLEKSTTLYYSTTTIRLLLKVVVNCSVGVVCMRNGQQSADYYTLNFLTNKARLSLCWLFCYLFSYYPPFFPGIGLRLWLYKQQREQQRVCVTLQHPRHYIYTLQYMHTLCMFRYPSWGYHFVFMLLKKHVVTIYGTA